MWCPLSCPYRPERREARCRPPGASASSKVERSEAGLGARSSLHTALRLLQQRHALAATRSTARARLRDDWVLLHQSPPPPGIDWLLADFIFFNLILFTSLFSVTYPRPHRSPSASASASPSASPSASALSPTPISPGHPRGAATHVPAPTGRRPCGTADHLSPEHPNTLTQALTLTLTPQHPTPSPHPHPNTLTP